MRETLKDHIYKVGNSLGLKFGREDFVVEHPNELSHGDYSTNIAMVLAKKESTNPQELAQKISEGLEKEGISGVQKIEVAGPGFINFTLATTFFADKIQKISNDKNFGKNNLLKREKIMIEYTDPNPFKQFHIGHLMSNAIGESLARLYEWNGAKVFRANYQGDVGLHVAKAIWGMMKMDADFPNEEDDIETRTKFLGDAYVLGASKYEDDPTTKTEIDNLNVRIFEHLNGKFDEEIDRYYSKGREWSLEHFEDLYSQLDTKFDYYFFESQTAKSGLKLVQKNIGKIFRESEGAIIFPGEEYGLHNRVFINSKGLPTYEAKDLALADLKRKKKRVSKSIIITAQEQKDYFDVVLKALQQLNKKLAQKTQHITHGMMRFQEGKMSSRTGNIITGESLLKDIEAAILEKMANREMDDAKKSDTAKKLAVASLKYSILKQSPGKDIIFDREASTSFDGDSGPYLMYSLVRANSILDKALQKDFGVQQSDYKPFEIEKILYRFPEVVEDSLKEQGPHIVLHYLLECASSFNEFYANNKIIGTEDESRKLAVVSAFKNVLQNGLNILGIPTVDEM